MRVRSVLVIIKSVFSGHICFCSNTACEETREWWGSKRTVVTPFGNGHVRMCWFFLFFFLGGCDHDLILESSWSTCSWLSCESWAVDETQSHPSYSPPTHTHTHKQTPTRGFPIAPGRASCYNRLSLIWLAVWPLVSTACKALIDHSLFAGFGPQGHSHRGHGVVHLTPLVM